MIALASDHGICPGMTKVLIDTVTYCIDICLKEEIRIDRRKINALSPLFLKAGIYIVLIITQILCKRGIVNEVLRNIKIQFKSPLIFRIVFLNSAVEDICDRFFKIRFSFEEVFNRHVVADLSGPVLVSRRTVGAFSFYLRTCRRKQIT